MEERGKAGSHTWQDAATRPFDMVVDGRDGLGPCRDEGGRSR